MEKSTGLIFWKVLFLNKIILLHSIHTTKYEIGNDLENEVKVPLGP